MANACTVLFWDGGDKTEPKSPRTVLQIFSPPPWIQISTCLNCKCHISLHSQALFSRIQWDTNTNCVKHMPRQVVPRGQSPWKMQNFDHLDWALISSTFPVTPRPEENHSIMGRRRPVPEHSQQGPPGLGTHRTTEF